MFYFSSINRNKRKTLTISFFSLYLPLFILFQHFEGKTNWIADYRRICMHHIKKKKRRRINGESGNLNVLLIYGKFQHFIFRLQIYNILHCIVIEARLEKQHFLKSQFNKI